MARLEWLIDKSVGSFLCFVLGSINKIRPKRKGVNSIIIPKNILIIKLWALGESVLTLPMIKGIRQKYPDSKITVIARKQNKAVYENIPFIDNIIEFEPKNFLRLFCLFSKFDLSFDCEPYLKLSGLVSWFCAKQRVGFSHTIRSWLYTNTVDFNDKQNEVLTYMDMARIAGVNYVPEQLEKLVYSPENKKKVDSLLKEANISESDFIVGLCVGSGGSSKQRMWPSEYFAQLADKLIEEKNAKIIFVGAPNESELITVVRSKMKHASFSTAGKTNIRDLFYLAECCKLVVSNDTGPMHVAAAQGAKTIGLFGPNLSVRFGPFGKNNASIEKFLPCRPCINVHKGQLPKCKFKDDKEGYCMKLISVDDVYAAAKKLIE